MASSLTAWVNSRLDSDEGLSDDAKLLVLAALDGKTALADMTGYAPPESEPETEPDEEPVGAFLKQIKVEGFRGIGPQSQLDLDPFPSLTVISGRNGSGKSSFAEALEVTLTGTSYRWHRRASQWKERWRNIHNGEPARIDVTLAEEGVGSTRVSAEWSSGAELEDVDMSLQRQGEKKIAGTESLGWTGPLETYRPLLTYEELGELLSSAPNVLYDAISSVLGLGQLSAAVKALDEHRKTATASEGALKKDKKAILEALGDVDDERAARALALLKKRSPDTDELRRLATGTSEQTGLSTQLHALLGLTIPSEDECTNAATELRTAVQSFADLGDRIGDALQRRHELLTAAVQLHEHEGDQPCPVCGEGVLDTEKAATLRTELHTGRELLTQLTSARRRRSTALSNATALIAPAPSALTADCPSQLDDPASLAATAWEEWARHPDGALDLADHLVAKQQPVHEALTALQTETRTLISAMDETWNTIAARLGAYAEAADAVEATKSATAAATAAHKWLKDNEIVLKNERVRPIADEARKIWASLRQESNVEIAGVTLESSNTRRRVTIAAEVDGEAAGALAVMSQGELHALALALFLPRATASDSPFRFVVLDDPVQAMDPAKVDGLVNVLLEIAKTRQVVVFSHDDRFASAVRRAPRDVPIKVLEVNREANSQVTPVVTYSPADRYLRDAFGLVKDGGLPDDTLHRVLPGLLRMALEAQCRETYFASQLSGGADHHAIETAWEQNPKTRERISLALGFDDSSKVTAWLGRASHRKWALQKANSVHFKLEHGVPIDACRDVEKTLADIKAGVR